MLECNGSSQCYVNMTFKEIADLSIPLTNPTQPVMSSLLLLDILKLKVAFVMIQTSEKGNNG